MSVLDVGSYSCLRKRLPSVPVGRVPLQVEYSTSAARTRRSGCGLASRPARPWSTTRTACKVRRVAPSLIGFQGRRIAAFLPLIAVDRRGIAPRYRPCDGGVFLFDQQPIREV